MPNVLRCRQVVPLLQKRQSTAEEVRLTEKAVGTGRDGAKDNQ
jgi:hypothetical protein